MSRAPAFPCCRPESATFTVAERLLMRFGASDLSGLTHLLADHVAWTGPTPARPSGSHGVFSRREIESFLLSCYGILTPTGLSVRSLVVDGEQAIAIGRVRCLVRATGTDRVIDFAASIRVGGGVVDACWLLARVAAPPAAPWRAER